MERPQEIRRFVAFGTIACLINAAATMLMMDFNLRDREVIEKIAERIDFIGQAVTKVLKLLAVRNRQACISGLGRRPEQHRQISLLFQRLDTRINMLLNAAGQSKRHQQGYRARAFSQDCFIEAPQ